MRRLEWQAGLCSCLEVTTNDIIAQTSPSCISVPDLPHCSLVYGFSLTAGFMGPRVPLVKCNTFDLGFAGCAVPLRSCRLMLPLIMTAGGFCGEKN